MKTIHLSQIAELSDHPCQDEIHLFTQFFIHKKHQRNKEINVCLNNNANNPHINKIHLLNERMYTHQELNVANNHQKIKQENIGQRITFKHIIQYIRTQNIKGYFIFSNMDIFFDDTLKNVKKSTIHEQKKMFALLRYEYNDTNPTQSNIFGPRFDSQDTWIFHSNHFIQSHQEKIMNIPFGQPGCDNKIVYLMNVLGFEVINDPHFIKTYHYHKETTRNYTIKGIIGEPWGFAVPCHCDLLRLPTSLGVNLFQVYQHTRGFKDVNFNDNKTIHDYIKNKISENKHFIIPRVSVIENNLAVFARMLKKNNNLISTNVQQIIPEIHKMIPEIKNNAGIQLSGLQSIIKYSDMYLSAFENCEMFAGWEIQGNQVKQMQTSYNYILQNYASNKQIIWALNFDIFHYIYNQPWTFALKGKKILLISCFEESLKKQIPIREKIYDGVDLFPECVFEILKPPMTNANNPSEEFDVELIRFYEKLNVVKNQYDVALVSAGGYSTIICNHIFNSGKSAIQVSGVLQMYFGILGKRWLKERKDVVQLFMNEHWTKPLETEKPPNWENVEGGCYWI